MADHSAGQAIGRAALARIRRRLLPFTFLLYIVAYLDRINVGFAALEMNRQLGLGDAAYGLGAGLFFIGYFLFEVPSNLILHRVGARAWIARIMISWGVVAIAMAAVRGAASFYLLRFLLGVAEAGFFPGIILYLTYWFPAREQARSIALFMTASALAGVIGGPLSGALLAMDGALGLSGWQWLFVLEGAPSVILGLTVLFYLPNGPGDARWLTAAEKRWLAERLEFERSSGKEGGLVRTLTDGRVWLLSMLYFAIVTGLYGVTLWLPQIIKGFGALGNFEIGVISAVPFLVAAIAMVGIGRSSDRRGERRWHVAFSAFAAAAGLTISALTRNPVIALAALSLGAAGIWGTMGPFWSMPPAFLSGAGAAAGIALINSVGNLGGFVGPYLVGLVRQKSHSFSGGLAAMAAMLALAGCLALALRDDAG
ncbi:MAG TPA: MFS transporter [Candidatus Binataceae bacterium]|nr:MFS transporter [Candidatus Binataceae bacterium]